MHNTQSPSLVVVLRRDEAECHGRQHLLLCLRIEHSKSMCLLFLQGIYECVLSISASNYMHHFTQKAGGGRGSSKANLRGTTPYHLPLTARMLSTRVWCSATLFFKNYMWNFGVKIGIFRRKCKFCWEK